MANNRRDDFPVRTKLRLAERVAWRCSFPGCPRITIGPDSHDPSGRINLGKAAHITAASPEGPRYDGTINSEQRKAISNGIWMCAHHADLIDADFREYSTETLRSWKINAERIAAEQLKAIDNEYLVDPSTLFQLGSEIIFYAQWKGIAANEWTFQLSTPLLGDINGIMKYVEGFNRLAKIEQFIVIESQGDARVISSPPKLENTGNAILVTVAVKDPPEAIDPSNIRTYALG